ncbi:TPA: DUF1327 domain-containing protein [Yersinia enterocolitica]|uniref:DUF1327 domain-containing protein n=1 Tax=Yersinia enterocolitica TaxID=630 RepID=UPI0005FCE32E|nr:DUF1327 domain-containing protein [Yersinia enterocolitica]EKN5933409.1 DUF1327 domain-containing protein [Yersinia enterocolitica]CRE89141.1 Protein of uncharacterised function (DUF1327) [Yersinia enterocolitica]HDL7350235.1 DUF1327 domain-containing protein [Yersinia enterocolitica]HDL7805817.1 DUF1327 domain-containing protein [Yersinia enterocolitica]HEN3445829.1 DUF1327 domain-containing protein [Yersinia enterocolitica]
MTKQYELAVKYINNEEGFVNVTVALSYPGISYGEILSINCRVDKIDGESLEYYESVAINKAKDALKQIASQL